MTNVKKKVYRDGALNYDTNEASLESAISCPEDTRTQQSGKLDADINEIVRRFGVTGTLPQGTRPPTYGDFNDVFDFQTAQNAIVIAQQSFMAMPATVRKRFNNDPHEFVAFCSEPENIDEMRKMGLAVPKKEVIIAEKKPDNLDSTENKDGRNKDNERSKDNSGTS